MKEEGNDQIISGIYPSIFFPLLLKIQIIKGIDM